MENKIILNDDVKLTDSLEHKRGGYVILRNANTGEIVFKKHNMIVREGRKFILQKMLGINNENRAISTIKFGSDNTLTEPQFTKLKNLQDTYTIDTLTAASGTDVNNWDLASYLTTLKNTTGLTKSCKYYVDSSHGGTDGDLYVRYHAIIIGNSSSATYFRELGLFLSDGNMFSRVVFDPVPIHQDVIYVLDYYVYF